MQVKTTIKNKKSIQYEEPENKDEKRNSLINIILNNRTASAQSFFSSHLKFKSKLSNVELPILKKPLKHKNSKGNSIGKNL